MLNFFSLFPWLFLGYLFLLNFSFKGYFHLAYLEGISNIKSGREMISHTCHAFGLHYPDLTFNHLFKWPNISKDVSILGVGSYEVVIIMKTFESKKLIELNLMDGASKGLPSIKDCLFFNISCFISICGFQVLKYFIHYKISFLDPSSFEVPTFNSLNVSHKQSFKVFSYNYELGYSLVVLVQSLPQYS